MFRNFCFVIALTISGLSSSNAAVVTIVAESVGSYSGGQTHNANDYVVSAFPAFPTVSFRNYAVFDLSSVDDQILSAEIQTSSGQDVGRADDVTISFLSFGGDIANLRNGNASYDTLDDGDLFGSLFAPASIPDASSVTIGLNANAIASLNSTSGLIAITGVQVPGTNTSGFFAGVQSSQVQLSLTTIPEPATVGMLVLISSGLVMSRRRTR